MTARQRFHAVMNFKSFDRLPVIEWAEWWDKTIERWHKEGLPAEISNRYDICEHFGLDIYKQYWFPISKETCPSPAAHGAGIIKTEKDYESVRQHLFPEPEKVVDKSVWSKWAEEQEAGRVVLWFTVEGFFWVPRKLFGIEPHLYAFYDQPRLMHRINSELSEWIIKITEYLCSICVPDFMTIGEDMSYNHGPMLSEELFNTFMKPYYARVIPHLRKRKILTIVDSDGDISVPARWFREAGVQGLLPLERQAGVDISTLKERYPDMRFIGHYDKMVMNKGEEALRKEFERLMPSAAKGGFLVGCDHQTPPGVSLENYRLYLKLFNEYAEVAGRLSRTPDSGRIAD